MDGNGDKRKRLATLLKEELPHFDNFSVLLLLVAAELSELSFKSVDEWEKKRLEEMTEVAEKFLNLMHPEKDNSGEN